MTKIQKVILHETIEEFLKNYVKIKPGNERAKATSQDIDKLREIIQMLCHQKWESSYDGWTPAQVEIINRSTHEQLNYYPLPYEGQEKMHIAMQNLRIATKDANESWVSHKSLKKE